jgi:hypothetical protein
MNWYLAKLIFNININNGSNVAQFDEQTRLIAATNFEDAFFKAKKIGKSDEENFLSKDLNKVDWKFIDVTDIIQVNNVKDGQQIFSATSEQEDPDHYISCVKQRSLVLQAKNLSFA